MDPIADMLTKIRNAQAARKRTVSISYSSFKYDIVKILEKEGFIGDFKRRKGKTEKRIVVSLKYEDKEPVINEIKRVSKLGRRIYLKKKELYIPKGGRGALIVSTPKGVMTSKEARKLNVGGEVVCEIW